MAKGQIAKDYVAKKLAEAFGEHYLGEVDKKPKLSNVKSSINAIRKGAGAEFVK